MIQSHGGTRAIERYLGCRRAVECNCGELRFYFGHFTFGFRSHLQRARESDR